MKRVSCSVSCHLGVGRGVRLYVMMIYKQIMFVSKYLSKDTGGLTDVLGGWALGSARAVFLGVYI